MVNNSHIYRSHELLVTSFFSKSCSCFLISDHVSTQRTVVVVVVVFS